jgi:DegV family protein with EDD domain
MREYKIFTDSTADMPDSMVKEFDITVVPTEFFIGGKSYLDFPDARELHPREFYGQIRNGEMPTTAVINPERFRDYFEPVLKEGKDILHIVFSSGLTTTMQNSRIAAEELKEGYPGGRIVIVDSRSASMGKALLVYYAAKKKQDGASIDEVAEWVERTRDHVCGWFTVDDLNHLRRGGRVTVTAAMVGGVLNIKPVMHISLEGKLEPVDKVRGRKTAIETVISKVGELGEDIGEQIVFVVHGDCEEDAEYMAEEIKKRYNPKEVVINYVGPVIGTHAGPGALAVFFIGKEK